MKKRFKSKDKKKVEVRQGKIYARRTERKAER
jgi:hypothetical protein